MLDALLKSLFTGQNGTHMGSSMPWLSDGSSPNAFASMGDSMPWTNGTPASGGFLNQLLSQLGSQMGGGMGGSNSSMMGGQNKKSLNNPVQMAQVQNNMSPYKYANTGMGSLDELLTSLSRG